jgi:hypothetical protein
MQTQCATYDWTLKKLEEYDTLIEKLKPLFKKWVFQEEASDTGYVHFQGRGSLFKKRRIQELKPILDDLGLSEMHLSPTVTENQKGEPFYMTKADTRVAGPWKDTDPVSEYVPRQYRGLMDRLYPYQQRIYESAQIFDSRTINLIYDPWGNNGKSTITALCRLHAKGIKIPAVNDAEKLLASVCDILVARNERQPGVVFVDLPRSMDKRKLSGIYAAIEEIKNGCVYDLRYSYKEWWFDSPAVWVFTNIEPDLSFLSMDRWKLWSVTPDKDLEPIEPTG